MANTSRPHDRTITARDLGRNVAAILDDVEIERRSLLVTRGGRPVASLVPLGTPLGASSTSEALRVFVLTPTERRILLQAASHPSRARASFEEPGDDARELGRTLVRMEREGLLERGFSGHIVTATGQVVAAALQADG